MADTPAGVLIRMRHINPSCILFTGAEPGALLLLLKYKIKKSLYAGSSPILHTLYIKGLFAGLPASEFYYFMYYFKVTGCRI